MSNKKDISKERIILNVGGIKYETYRSTLTEYPDTMLGTMFSERNTKLLHPVNGNEYYINRNGRLFYYILQFYRTRKIPCIDKVKTTIPITQKQLNAELDFFMIPRPKQISTQKPQCVQKLSLRSRTIATELDKFIHALKTALNTVINYFQKRFIMSEGGQGFNITLEISFYASDKIPHLITVLPTIIGKSPVPLITPIFEEHSFGTKAYVLLNKFGDKIGDYLEALYPGLYWDLQWLEHCSDGTQLVDGMFRVKMSLCDKFDYEDIIHNCCLSTTTLKYYKY
ncbi:9499_t:CDS:2 [Diversispora eburnea]|uniref:9499_t:CDS:1 n=1 Tax=Diversispora eburnea TaxID=1213867 RepID=A0A9N8YNM5_9GLOM|nr:9499_t:CDS:2 [Diversispora eburnea]